jgi:hypothetical protein
MRPGPETRRRSGRGTTGWLGVNGLNLTSREPAVSTAVHCVVDTHVMLRRPLTGSTEYAGWLLGEAGLTVPLGHDHQLQCTDRGTFAWFRPALESRWNRR